MTTQPIEHTGYGYTYRKPRKQQGDVDFPLGPEQSKKRQETADSTGPSSRDRIRRLLAEIPTSENNTLTFQSVVEYRDRIEKDWEARVSGELAAFGVDTSTKFRLVYDPATGTVEANGDHPDKAKIDQYFVANPDAADEFKTIMQLGKLTDAARQRLSPQEMETSLSPEAMAWWFDTNMDAASLFSGGGTVFGVGSAYKGLDIRV